MASFKWNIFLANLDPVIGSEQGKTRPVLVISEEQINQILPVVNVLPITSSDKGWFFNGLAWVLSQRFFWIRSFCALKPFAAYVCVRKIYVKSLVHRLRKKELQNEEQYPIKVYDEDGIQKLQDVNFVIFFPTGPLWG